MALAGIKQGKREVETDGLGYAVLLLSVLALIYTNSKYIIHSSMKHSLAAYLVYVSDSKLLNRLVLFPRLPRNPTMKRAQRETHHSQEFITGKPDNQHFSMC